MCGISRYTCHRICPTFVGPARCVPKQQNMCPTFLGTPVTPFVQHLYHIVCKSFKECVPRYIPHRSFLGTLATPYIQHLYTLPLDLYPGISLTEYFLVRLPQDMSNLQYLILHVMSFIFQQPTLILHEPFIFSNSSSFQKICYLTLFMYHCKNYSVK